MNTITLSLNRVKSLFIEYFVLYWKRDLAIFGSLFLIEVILTYQHWPPFTEFFIFMIAMILIGISSPLGKRLRGMNYLSCPANTAEKFITNLLLVHIYYTVMLVLAGGFGTHIGYLLNPLNLEQFTVVDSDVNQHFYRFFLFLFVFQSIFIFMTIYFKKNALLKTLLFFGALFLVFIISVMIFFYLARNVEAVGRLVGALGEAELKYIISYTIDKYIWISRVLVYGAIAFFWVLSYLRLKETEV